MEHILTILDIGLGGDGIARLPDGESVFIPFTAPGDVVRASVERGGDKILRGRIKSMESPSPSRANPPCRHFTRCGGCALQHLSKEAYRQFKREGVAETLRRVGIVLPDDFSAIHVPAGTRRRANFAGICVRGHAQIGFHERRSATIRDVPDCLLISEDVRRVMERFRSFLPRLAGEGKKMDILIQCVEEQAEIGLTGKLLQTLDAQEALAECVHALGLSRISLRARDYEPYEVLLEARPFLKRFGNLSVNLAPGAFLQPSAEGERALVDLVLAGLGDESHVADLFCGNGTFTGALLAQGRRVLAADFAPDAIEALNRAGVQAAVRNLFTDPLSGAELEGVEAVVLDPPRAGANAQCHILAPSHVPKIVYVSCNPQSFAKDAALLMGGGYRLNRLTLVDQFIWSAHTEIVGIFNKT